MSVLTGLREKDCDFKDISLLHSETLSERNKNSKTIKEPLWSNSLYSTNELLNHWPERIDEL
jgi:hypothetical protein